MTEQQITQERNRLLSIATLRWPAELQGFVSARCYKYGGCMDVIACAIEDWLREQNPTETRPAA